MAHTPLREREELRGYVTTCRAVCRKPSSVLEDILGFNRGALAEGYWVYRLVGRVELGDFEWKDRTRYSDGWHFDVSIGEYVQRQDEYRAHYGKLMQYSEVRVDEQIKGMLERQRARLNREGQIVKVIAKTEIQSYPDSTHRDVPQWTLKVKKPFVRIADIGPGQMLRECPP